MPGWASARCSPTRASSSGDSPGWALRRLTAGARSSTHRPRTRPTGSTPTRQEIAMESSSTPSRRGRLVDRQAWFAEISPACTSSCGRSELGNPAVAEPLATAATPDVIAWFTSSDPALCRARRSPTRCRQSPGSGDDDSPHGRRKPCGQRAAFAREPSRTEMTNDNRRTDRRATTRAEGNVMDVQPLSQLIRHLKLPESGRNTHA